MPERKSVFNESIRRAFKQVGLTKEALSVPGAIITPQQWGRIMEIMAGHEDEPIIPKDEIQFPFSEDLSDED